MFTMRAVSVAGLNVSPRRETAKMFKSVWTLVAERYWFVFCSGVGLSYRSTGAKVFGILW